MFSGVAQDGKIGIVLCSDWAEPLTDAPEDVEAAQRYVYSPLMNGIVLEKDT